MRKRETKARRATRPPMAEAASQARLCRNTSDLPIEPSFTRAAQPVKATGEPGPDCAARPQPALPSRSQALTGTNILTAALA